MDPNRYPGHKSRFSREYEDHLLRKYSLLRLERQNGQGTQNPQTTRFPGISRDYNESSERQFKSTTRESSRKKKHHEIIPSRHRQENDARTLNRYTKLEYVPFVSESERREGLIRRETQNYQKYLREIDEPKIKETKIQKREDNLKGPEKQNVEKQNAPANKAPYIKLRNLADNDVTYTDTLHKKSVETTMCGNHCAGALMTTLNQPPDKSRSKEELIEQATDFFEQYYKASKSDNHEQKRRLKEVMNSIESTGTYELTYDELVFGSKMAWRNAPRCIGRIQWNNLKIFDARKETTTKGMFEALCRHIEYATNKGNIRSAITLFRQRTDPKRDFRVWNPQLIMYAGYRQPDGSVIGDPITVEFTAFCMEMGWKGKNGMYDVLPLVLQANGGEPEWFEIPQNLILEVKIIHPKYPSLAKLGLKWYALPAVTGMKLDCGGLEFTASPFNGWYMSTEIAARDLCDKQRYNMIDKIASNLGIEMNGNASLWKDKTVLEINIAVLHSFQSLNITIMDHHTASESFMTFLHNEYKQRGGCPADWVWLVPPISGSLTDVFHQELVLFKLKPAFEYQDLIWKTYASKNGRGGRPRRKLKFKTVARAVFFSSVLVRKVFAHRTKCTILYATETGRSEKFANTLNEIFKQSFNSRVLNMEKYAFSDIQQECLMLFVTSTFGNGDPPENGKGFAQNIGQVKQIPFQNGHVRTGRRIDNSGGNSHRQMPDGVQHIKFGAFGLGSRAYPNFCAFSRFIDKTLANLGATRIQDMGEGDELSGQDESFRTWAKQVFQAACRKFNIGNKHGVLDASNILAQNDTTWRPGKFRLVPALRNERVSIADGLSKVYSKTVYTCTMKDKYDLQTEKSSRQTILVKIDLGDNAKKVIYSPGDHVLLFPKNPAKLVRSIIHHLRDVPNQDQVMKIEHATNDGTVDSFASFDRFPPSKLEDLLSRYLDITTPPSQDLLKKMSGLATKEQDKTEIQRLANNTDLYDEWKHNGMPNIADVIKSFQSLHVTPDFLITQLPVLQPRYYSISSSLEATPGQIHVTAELLEYRTPNGVKHKGVCTYWLDSLNTGDVIHCAIRSAPLFHMPTDSTVPIIMVGPGTGIAPFRSFWMQRKFDKPRRQPPRGQYKTGWGEMYLYFGCRYAVADNIYKDELEQCEKDGVLDKCFFAYSREPGTQKTYVQDLLMANGKDVYRKIYTEHGHFYICGNVQMASDVKDMLCKIMETCGRMSPREAKDFIDGLKRDNRLHEDIFGLALSSSGKVKGLSKSTGNA